MGWSVRNSLLILATVLLFQTVTSELLEDKYNENCTTKVFEDNVTGSRVLSRRKRFLTFPDGSSFQLVFCLQTSALIPIGDIFLYGSTLALAWALPSDPDFFKMVKDGYKLAQRRGDKKNEVFYINEDGKIMGKVPYKRFPVINPVFTKRSIDDNMTFKEKLNIKKERMKMHEKQLNRDYLKTHINENSIEFHRNSRVDLYEKIEKLLTELGRDGRQCVLHKLCEAARGTEHQGTFLQELLTIVFTLPKGKQFDAEHHQAYDKAHIITEDCDSLYPGCDNLTAN